MKQSRKEFIITAHKEACEEWKRKIENEFPKLFKKKQKFDEWFVDTNLPKWLMFYAKDGSVFGIDKKGEWYHSNTASYNPYLYPTNRLATEQEVKEALIKEADKRGYKDGVFVNSFVHNLVLQIKNSKNNIEFISFHNKLHYGNDSNWYVVIFENGKWAEIIPNTITRSEAEKQLNAKIID